MLIPIGGLAMPAKIALGMLAFAVIMWVTEAVSYPVSAVMIVGLIAIMLTFATDPETGEAVGASKGLSIAMSGFSSSAVALVAAGYNAGPGRSARWLRDFGDLRIAGRAGADPVDWVEMIPFDETRIYVMRVAESLPMYRARIAGHPVPLVPTWDLRGGVSLPPPVISPLVLALSDRPRGAAFSRAGA